MNERIKELAKQANTIGDWGEDITEGRYFVYPSIKNLEKFAELIVAECVKLCEHESNDDEYDQYDMGQSVKAENIKTAIKQHFGVEE
jgi:hypothetical protein